MRVIADFPNPDFKISLLFFNQKFILKFEQGNLEQIYKIAEIDVIDGIQGIERIVSNTIFLQQVREQFTIMRSSFTLVIKTENII